MKYLLVGLGNPKDKYHFTRHNAGADGLLLALAGCDWRTKDLYEFFDDDLDDNEIIAILPSTFMNDSGLAVKKAAKDFNVKNKNIIIIHDDADLPLGQVKLSFASGSAGHRGVDSTIEYLGAKNFWRLRYGLGRPEGEPDLTDFVLQSWLPNEKEILLDFAAELAEEIIKLKTAGWFFKKNLTLRE